MKLWRAGQAIEALGQRDRYVLREPLGSGGMADVWLALDRREQRTVAIKVLKEEFSEDQDALDRFAAEIEQMMRLQHPHILRVYSSLRPKVLDGSMIHYTVMEYARGGDLHNRLRKGVPHDFAQTLSIIEQIGSAVQYAHEQGVIHRDIKPRNILLRRPVREPLEALLSDFGMAVEIGATHHTYPGGGTLPYMAPEQIRGQAQAASDIFSLGVVLYQLCTGVLPFQRSRADLARPADAAPPAPASTLNARIPPALDAVLASALANEPTQRPASPALFVQRVQEAVIPPQTPVGTSFSRPLPGAGTITAPMPAPPDDDEWGIALPAVTSPAPVLSPVPDSEPGIITLGGGSRLQHIPTPNAPHTQPGLNPIAPPRQPARPAPTRIAPARRTRRRGVIFIALLACTALLVSAIIFATNRPDTSLPLGGPFAFTVNITPDVQTVSNTYVVSAVTGTPDPNGLQVQARVLTGDAQSTGQTVNATGQKQTAATRASGFLTFYNSNTTAMTLARMVITAPNGVKVEIDTAVTIPAGSPASPNPQTVAATAVQPGASGNIVAAAIDGGCCASGISVKNLYAFSGGADPQNYTIVQQSDITNVSDSITPNLVTKAQAALSAKLGRSERYAENGTCTPTVGSDHNAGDKAPTVTVQVSVHCTREVYDTSQIAAVVTQHMNLTVKQTTGSNFSGYALLDGQGNAATLATVLSEKQTNFNAQTGQVTLQVQASGTWVYQFTPAVQQQIKMLIAGKTVAQAITILQSQPGIKGVTIQPTSGTLPTDLGQFGIVVTKEHGVGAPGGGSGSGGGAAEGTPVMTSPTVGPLPTGTGVGMG